MAKCEWCGVRFNKSDAEEIFDSEAYFWYFDYKKIRPCLCGECAVKAVFDEDDEGIYFDTCDECRKEFDLKEEETAFRLFADKYGGSATLRDYWDDRILCADCAAQVFYNDITEDSDYDDDEDRNEGCVACGNPAYPDCMSGCPAFDD